MKSFSKILLFLINIILGSSILLAEEKQLKGNPISSDIASEIINNAFDGDITTEFKSIQNSNGWIGLEFENSYRITKIGWAQKESDKENYLLGIFEGGNDPSFFDAVPLTMLTEEGKENEINYIDIDVTRSFKYIRYIGPNGKNCTISQLEFYGYEVKADEIEGIEEKLYQPTGIPLIVINTEGGVEPKDKETGVSCQIKIINKGKEENNAKGTIKLRGNSTMRSEKSPYKIKFEQKQNLLDLPAKAKKWNLMANHCDKTLIRTLLAMKISSLFEMPYTPECRPVDLIVNGEYKGNFNLCDKIEYHKNRVELGELDEGVEEEPVDGGYLFEATQYAYKEGFYLNTTKGIILGLRYPEEDVVSVEQIEYINNKLNKVEQDAYNGIVDNIDFQSFSKYLLVQELCGQSETFWSTYMTKKRNDEKIYFGPVWDFDLAFDNDERVYSTLNKTNFLFKYDSSAGTMREFAVKSLNNEELLQNVKDMWNEMTQEKVTIKKMLAFIDEQVEIINESQKLNFKRYDILNKRVMASPTARCSFKREVAFLKEYIAKRFELLNDIVGKATTTSVNEEVDHFDLDMINGPGFGPRPPFDNDTEHKWPDRPGGNGRPGGPQNQIVEECINFVEED